MRERDGQRALGVDVAGRQAPVPGGEAEEEVAARVLADAADAGDPEPGALGERLALAGEERRVRRDEDDDRPARLRAGLAGRGTTSAGMSSPTGTPSTRKRDRAP